MEKSVTIIFHGEPGPNGHITFYKEPIVEKRDVCPECSSRIIAIWNGIRCSKWFLLVLLLKKKEMCLSKFWFIFKHGFYATLVVSGCLLWTWALLVGPGWVFPVSLPVPALILGCIVGWLRSKEKV